MPTELLSFGVPYNLTTNVIYALPASVGILYSDTPAAVLRQSTDVGFTNNSLLTLVGGQAGFYGGFIRATGATSVILRRV